jgi:intracellular septation protein A
VAARIGLGIALIQAVVGPASQRAIGHFAPPVVANALYGLAFLVSVAVGRPLAGVFAREIYPTSDERRRLPGVQRAFARISIAWGVYLLARSALRLVVLLNFSIDVYVAVNVATAAPVTVALMGWSFWYGLRAIRYASREGATP